LAGPEHKACVRVADPGGELVESACHAGVGVRAEQDFAWPRVPLLRQGRMANAGIMRTILAFEHSPGGIEMPMTVWIVDHVVEISDPLLFYEVAQNIDVPVRFGVRGENVMVGNDDDLMAIPDLGVLAEFALKDTDSARSANIMGHENVGLDPD